MTTFALSARQKSHHHAVILPSLFWSRRHPDFYAVTSGISRAGILFRSATVPVPGERLSCSIGHVGTVEVLIVQSGVASFTGKPAVGRQRSAALARTLVDLAELQSDRPEAAKVQPRIVPRRTDLPVAIEDGSVLSGRLIDVSASGAAVYLGRSVAAGTRILLGSTEAVVARTFGNGVGAAFLTPLDPASVNQDIVL